MSHLEAENQSKLVDEKLRIGFPSPMFLRILHQVFGTSWIVCPDYVFGCSPQYLLRRIGEVTRETPRKFPSEPAFADPHESCRSWNRRWIRRRRRHRVSPALRFY